MFGLGVPEVIVLSLLALLLFGKKLPDVARALGKSVQEFRTGLKSVEEEVAGTLRG